MVYNYCIEDHNFRGASMRIFSIGEALIDFLPYEEKGFIPVTGGAPANVAACAAKLDREAYFIGKVGDDMFGDKIIRELKEAGVNISYLTKTAYANTALSFVTLRENGEREFAFYRKPSADMFLSPEDIGDIKFNRDDILHFCSVDLIDMPVKAATLKAIELIKRAGGTVSFDPNIRKVLWDDLDEYKKVVNEFLPMADVIKISEDECEFITGSADCDEIAKKLLKTAKLVLITFGAKGSRCYSRASVTNQKPFPINCVDTTGAGDSFIGTFLSYIDINNIENTISKALYYASACSGLVCSKKGVLTSLPTLIELREYIDSVRDDL
ncbi:MAG: carbohydrate kinase [Clostridia bacterium]|nr:carbohydrate kinase [Clostridia bacterium]